MPVFVPPVFKVELFTVQLKVSVFVQNKIIMAFNAFVLSDFVGIGNEYWHNFRHKKTAGTSAGAFGKALWLEGSPARTDYNGQ